MLHCDMCIAGNRIVQMGFQMITSGLITSNTDNWSTPDDLFRILDNEFHFTLDVCADEDNHKCDRYFDKETDGLKQKWNKDIAWMNPPYGKEIGKWMEKAVDSMLGGGALFVWFLPGQIQDGGMIQS